jgi:hypothetical protein
MSAMKDRLQVNTVEGQHIRVPSCKVRGNKAEHPLTPQNAELGNTGGPTDINQVLL